MHGIFDEIYFEGLPVSFLSKRKAYENAWLALKPEGILYLDFTWALGFTNVIEKMIFLSPFECLIPVQKQPSFQRLGSDDYIQSFALFGKALEFLGFNSMEVSSEGVNPFNGFPNHNLISIEKIAKP